MTMIQQISIFSRAVILAWGLGLLAGPAVWGADAPASASEAAPSEWTTGEVRKINKADGKLTIRHEDIKNLNMPAMTMVFKVKNPDMLEGVKVGDKIQFKAVQEQGKLIVTDIQWAKLEGAQSQAVSDKDNMKHARKMKMNEDNMQKMEKHIEQMREMVQKWDAAETPEARQALMEEHHRMMHEGMEMSPKKGGHQHH